MKTLDVFIILLYFAVIIFIGFYVARKYVKSGEDAAVAGRKLGIFLGGVGKAANSAGGSSSVGGTSWGYQLGIGASWYAVSEGLTYVVYLPIIKRIWTALYRTRASSAGKFFGYRWGDGARLYAGLINGICYIAFVAAQIIATATVIKVLLGWDYLPSLFISTAVIIIYCTAGGLRAIVITDVIQMSLIIAGMLIIMPPIVFKAAGDKLGGGGIGAVWDALASGEATSFMTNLGAPGVFGWTYIIGAIILPCILIGGVAQASFQYQSSIQSASKAFKSFIMVPFLYIPVSIMVVLMGMCAVIIYGTRFLGPEYGGAGEDPNFILPTLITDYLPQGLTGLLLAAILSATMSTSSTCLICSTTCIVEDVIKPAWEKKTGKPYTKKSSLLLFRVAMILIGLSTILITLFAKDIIELITTGYAAAVAGLFVPFMCTMFVKSTTKLATYITMISGFALYLIIWIGSSFGGLTLPGAFGAAVVSAPLYLTLPFSIVIMAIVIFATKHASKGSEGWLGHGNRDAFFTDEWEKSEKNWEKHPEILEERLDVEV
ncbi:MAG: sodium:solute symporter family protein [Clostridiales Family XIII bacterium]|jgi:SSS family solute:Na+ symporter|nr:sodium:solute symporter family protein [Clostridiales Family XIII bacterium]